MIVLVIAAFVTSIVSAILGMAGGVMLMAVMYNYLDHKELIPTHAVVQIGSNGTRAIAFLKHVDFNAFGRFLIGVAPGGAIGAYLLWRIGDLGENEPYFKMLVGIYILAATWMPKPGGQSKSHGEEAGQDGASQEDSKPFWDFPIVGFFAGTAALLVGAVGPLIAPVFARRSFAKEPLIATKAVCQLSTHLIKVPAFILLRDLDLQKLGWLAFAMILAVIPGTLVGKRLLKGVAERHFKVAFRVALTLAGGKILVVDGLMKVIG